MWNAHNRPRPPRTARDRPGPPCSSVLQLMASSWAVRAHQPSSPAKIVRFAFMAAPTPSHYYQPDLDPIGDAHAPQRNSSLIRYENAACTGGYQHYNASKLLRVLCCMLMDWTDVGTLEVALCDLNDVFSLPETDTGSLHFRRRNAFTGQRGAFGRLFNALVYAVRGTHTFRLSNDRANDPPTHCHIGHHSKVVYSSTSAHLNVLFTCYGVR